jgi:hypothetical protein
VTADDLAVERGTYTFSVGSAAPTTPTASPVPVPIDGGGAPGDLYVLLLAGVLIAIVVGVVVIRGRR